jgi:hypothetical protein
MAYTKISFSREDNDRAIQKFRRALWCDYSYFTDHRILLSRNSCSHTAETQFAATEGENSHDPQGVGMTIFMLAVLYSLARNKSGGADPGDEKRWQTYDSCSLALLRSFCNPAAGWLISSAKTSQSVTACLPLNRLPMKYVSIS